VQPDLYLDRLLLQGRVRFFGFSLNRAIEPLCLAPDQNNNYRPKTETQYPKRERGASAVQYHRITAAFRVLIATRPLETRLGWPELRRGCRN
jgi:hypothetical protein